MPTRQLVDPASAQKFNRFGHGRVHMDFVLGDELLVPLDNRASWIQPGSPDAIGLQMGAFPMGALLDALWPAANEAHFFPYRPSENILVTGFFLANGSVVAGNVDLGIYSTSWVRLLSTGSTPQAGASSYQQIAVGAGSTITLTGNTNYWIALALSSAAARVYRYTFNPDVGGQIFRLLNKAAAFPLPADVSTPALAGIQPRIYGLLRELP